MNPISLVSPSGRYAAMRWLAELRQKKQAVVALEVLKKNGKSLPIELRASHVSGTLYFGLIRDLSEERKTFHLLQRKEEEYKAVIEGAATAIIVMFENDILFVNGRFIRLLHYQQLDDVIGKNINQFLTAESIRKYQRAIRRQESESIPQSTETDCVTKEGTTVICRTSITRVLFHGKRCLQFSFFDITEDKNLIEKLSTSHHRYQQIVETSEQPVTIIREGICIVANKAFLDLFEFQSADTIIGKEVTAIVDDSQKETFRDTLQKLSSSKGKQTVFSFSLTRHDGKKLLCDVTLVPFPDGTRNELLAYYWDKTQFETNRVDLLQKSEEINLLKTIIPSLLSSMDIQKLLHGILHKILDILLWEMGAMYSIEENTGKLQLSYQRNISREMIQKLSSLDIGEGIGGFPSKTLLPHRFSTDKYPSYLPFKSLFTRSGIKSLCIVPFVSKEKMVGMMLLCAREGSEHAKYSDDLLSTIGSIVGNAIVSTNIYRTVKESEERKHELIESSPDTLYISTPTGSFLQINSQIEALTGYTRKEFYRIKDLWLKLLHPEDKKIYFERITKLNELEKQMSVEYRILPKGKAVYRWVRDTISVVKNAEGIVTYILGSITDITDQKQFIDNLVTQNLLQETVISSITYGVIVFDKSLKCLRLNKALENLCGKVENEVCGRHALEILSRYTEVNLESSLNKALCGEIAHTDDILWNTGLNAPKVYVRGTFSPMRDRTGEIQGVVGTITDISQRKNYEDEIRESEHVLSNVIDTMGDILILTNLEGKVIQVNRAFLNTLGYNRSETNGCEFPYPWLVEEEMGRFVLWIANLREHNWLHDFDMTLRTKEGELIAVSLSTTLLRNHMGDPIAMLNIARNITERKKLMKDLENRNNQIEMINRIITKANQTSNFREIFSTVAKEIKTLIPCDDINIGLLSHDGKELNIYATTGRKTLEEGKVFRIGETLSQYAINEHKPIIVVDFTSDERYQSLAAFKEGIRSQLSFPLSLKGRIFGTLNLGSKEPYTFTEEHAITLQPIAQQVGAIIDRVLLFNQVSEDSAYIHNLLDSIDSIVYTVDTQLRIQEVNKAWYEFMKEFGIVGVKDYHDKELFEVLPSESLKIMFQNVIDSILNGSVRIFSQEFIHHSEKGDRFYNLTINPMVIERKITGLVFTHTDITALKKSEAELKKSNEQLLALHAISTVISSSLEIQKMLSDAIPLLKKNINATSVILYLLEPQSNDLTLAYQVGFESTEFATIFRLKQSSSATGEVITTRQSLYIQEKAYLDERIIPENREILKRLNLEAMAFIPLLSKDRVYGALDIFYNRAHIFSEQEQQILMLVGNQLGAAIENSQLYAELRSQVERLTVLYEISQQLTSTLNINQIFEVVYKYINQVVPFQMFKIDLYEEKTRIKTPVLHVEKMNGEEVFITTLAQPTLLTQGTTQEFVVNSKRTYQSPDRRIIYIPMLSKEVILGIMSIEADAETIYTETHLRLLESIGNLTAIALEKGKLYEETLQKSLEIQRRNKELDDFTYVVSHDLKEPLISVEGFSRILQLDYQEIIQAEGKEYLDSIVGATTRMKGLIDDLLLLSRISRPSESFKAFPAKNILDEVKTDIEFTIKQKGVEFIIPENLPIVFGNETQLKIVFRNLIGNAIKFNSNPKPKVEVGFQNTENNYYLFFIQDNGIGIDKEFHEKIFIIFQRLHRREEYEGSGAGLAIVKKIIEIHQGKIWVESELGKGSTFFFTIPKPLSKETEG
ncbi:MAG: PAS domain S-box protein [Ignavibacteriales bacterium]|nr:PAS domain S-box protein [Ignavibacteriales bacterium]